MSYDETVDIAVAHPKPKVRKVPRQAKQSRMKFHVCIPLYRGIPKELQSGWTRMGTHGVQEWNNTTNITEYILRNPHFDKHLYCGTCGRLMVKGKSETIIPLDNTKVIKLV